MELMSLLGAIFLPYSRTARESSYLDARARPMDLRARGVPANLGASELHQSIR